jgi:hypothetical protein
MWIGWEELVVVVVWNCVDLGGEGEVAGGVRNSRQTGQTHSRTAVVHMRYAPDVTDS